MSLFLQLCIDGIEQGSVYALWALSYGLVYQVLGLLNFAFGDSLLLCLYLIVGLTANGDLSIAAAVVVAFALAAFIFMLIERQVYSRFVRNRQVEAGFIAAVACAYLLRNVGTAIWGNEPLAFPSMFGNRVFDVYGIKIASGGAIVLTISVASLLAFASYLRFTKLGRGIVLLGQSPESAALVGIPIRRMVTVVYALSGVLGLIGAVLFSNLFQGVNSSLGIYITFQAFIAAIVGGVGSLAGAVLGGLALGLAEALSAGYVSGSFAEAFAWGAMAVVALVRPRGLLGRAEVERV